MTIWLVLRGHFGPIQGPPLKIERATQPLKIWNGAQITQLAFVEKIVHLSMFLCVPRVNGFVGDVQEKLLNSAKLDFSSNLKSLQSKSIC